MTAQATENGKVAAAQPVLMVTPLEGVEETAAALARKLGITVDLAATRAAALRLLNRRSYAAVILDQMLAEADTEGADLIWKSADLAVPIPVNFAIAGADRVEREVRAALARRHRETQLATAVAATELDAEIKNAVTGMLLESHRALAETAVSPEIQIRLRRLAGIADRLREKLAGAPAPATTLAGMPLAPRDGAKSALQNRQGVPSLGDCPGFGTNVTSR